MLSGHIENQTQSESTTVSVGRLASRLTALLFPLMVTTHLFLDLGYFLFLHNRLAARGWEGGLSYLLRGMHPTALSKHLLNAVRSVQFCIDHCSASLCLADDELVALTSLTYFMRRAVLDYKRARA